MTYKSNAFKERHYDKPVRIGLLHNKSYQRNRTYSIHGKSVSIKAKGGGQEACTGLYKLDLPDGRYYVRKLTPVECERLQTIPDNHTAKKD